jgi:hypothetical protein
MSIAERIKERVQRRKSILVAEWGEEDKPLAVYFGPLIAKELNQIQRKHPNFLSNAGLEGMVDLIVLKAEDADGKKHFTLEDKPVLMREEVHVISRVAGEMLSASEGVEQAGND